MLQGRTSSKDEEGKRITIGHGCQLVKEVCRWGKKGWRRQQGCGGNTICSAPQAQVFTCNFEPPSQPIQLSHYEHHLLYINKVDYIIALQMYSLEG